MGIKRNLVYSTVLTVSSYLFPLITFPYVTRVLGVASYGICSFYDSIVEYFILFSMLGIANLGIREIARAKEDKQQLAKTFSGLLSLNMLTTLISLVALLIFGLTNPEIAEHPQMIYIGAAKVLANSLVLEWFYKGIEDFRYITVRSILVRCLFVVAVFIFVRDTDDYVTFFAISTSTYVINAAINLVHLRKYITFSGLTFDFRGFVKPYIILGVYQLLTSMYTTLNVVILGFISGETQVGLYSTAVKLYTIIISFFTAFSGTILPRMSSLACKQDFESFNKLIGKSTGVLYLFCFPVIMITVLFAPTIIDIIAGSEFSQSVTPMRIVMPLMLVIGFEQVLIYQILFPLQRDKAIFVNSVLGAVTGLTLNFVLIPQLQAVGAALAWAGSELVVLMSAMIFVSKICRFNFNFKGLLKLFVYSIPPVGLILFFSLQNHQGFWPFLLISCLIFAYYITVDSYLLRLVDLKSLLSSRLHR